MARVRHTPAVVAPAVLVLLAATILAPSPEPAVAQSAAPETSVRKLERFRLAAGLGNYLGGLGLQGELFVLESRLSLVAGVGYMSGLNAAAAARGYLVAGEHHGGFLSVGVSPLAQRRTCLVQQDRAVPAGDDCGPTTVVDGPGFAAGYRFEMDRGFSVEAVVGGGWVEWAEPHRGIQEGEGYPLFALTAGYGF